MKRQLAAVTVLGLAGIAVVEGCNVVLGLERATLLDPDAGSGGGGTATTATTASATTGAGACVPGTIESCYEGPSGTEGKGICLAGTKTCNVDGTAYTPCAGQILPKQEDCTAPADEDCDGVSQPCKGSLLWAEGFGDAGAQHGTSIAVDGANNVLVAGYFDGTMVFGNDTLQAVVGPDIFIAKLDPSGKPLWAKSFGGAGEQKATSVAVDSAGNVLVAGYFDGAVDFGNNPLSSAAGSFFVAKLDPSGKHLWSKKFGTVDDDNRTFVATDSMNNVLVTGYFTDTVDFGGGNVVTGKGSSDIFVAKLDPTGKGVWSHSFGDASEQKATSIAVDSLNDVFITGEYFGTVNFGGNLLKDTGISNTDIFVAKFDPGGNPLWSHGYGDDKTQGGMSVAVDKLGNSLVTGYFSGSVDFGGSGGGLTSDGAANDVFIAKLDKDGQKVWSRAIGDAGQQAGAGIAADSLGDVLLTGYFYGSVDFGGGPLTGSIGTTVFVTALDLKGGHQWSKAFGAAADQIGSGIAVDKLDDVLVLGDYGAQIDFGGGPVTNAGSTDVFVAKFSK